MVVEENTGKTIWAMTPLELSKRGVRTLPLERRNAQCNALSHILSLCHHLLKCLCISYTLWKYNTPNSQLRNNPYPDTLPEKMVVCSHLLAFSEIAHSDYCFILSFTMSFLLALHLFIKKNIFIHFWLSLVIVVACGLHSCPAAHGMVIPQPEIEPTSPALEGRFLKTGPPGKSLALSLGWSWKFLFLFWSSA